MNNWLKNYIESQVRLLNELETEKIQQLIEYFQRAVRGDKQIFAFGNGGSSANASHFVTDMGKGAMDSLGKRIRCLSLNDNTPWLTALGNDYSYDKIFSRQLLNYGEKGDLVLAMSVSGNSPNVVQGLKTARKMELETILLTGSNDKCQSSEFADLTIPIGSDHFGRVEDLHMTLCHIVAYYFMEQESGL